MIRNKNTKKNNIITNITIIAVVLAIIFAIYGKKEMNIQAISNRHEEIQLNEEYVKEDFIFQDGGKTLRALTTSGEKKLKRNDMKLVLDGNVLGDITKIGNGYAMFVGKKEENETDEEFQKRKEEIGIREIEFKNLNTVEEIADFCFQHCNLTSLDLSPLKNLKHIGISAFIFNNIEKVNFTGLEKLEKIGEGAFSKNNLTGELDLSSLVNLQVIGRKSFRENNIEKINFTAVSYTHLTLPTTPYV